MMTAKDAPACLLPNRRVLILAGPAGAGGRSGASRFFEFDGTSIVRVADAANAGGVTYVGRMLLAPSGEVLFTDGSSTVAVYTPDAGYDSAWKPVIASCPTNVQLGQTFTLMRRQLNGLSQASVYGDDVQTSTNYPIVRAGTPRPVPCPTGGRRTTPPWASPPAQPRCPRLSRCPRRSTRARTSSW